MTDGNWADRLYDEFRDLMIRIEKLIAFKGSAGFCALQDDDQKDLATQLDCMKAYAKVLSRRLYRHNRGLLATQADAT